MDNFEIQMAVNHIKIHPILTFFSIVESYDIHSPKLPHPLLQTHTPMALAYYI